MKRAVLYARVSGDDRGKDGRNLQGQLEMCREYAEKKGWLVVAELAEDDRGVSGALLDLPQLDKARDMASEGKYDILITRELDRLARNLAKQLIVEEELRRTGVQIEYVLGEYPDSPEGNLNKQIRAVVAEYERLKITERVTRATRNKVKSGSVMVYGQPPYGYCEVEKDNKWALEVYEPEATIVRMIFELYVNGDSPEGPLSMWGIRARLNGLGIPTPGRRHQDAKRTRGEWSTATLHYILKREAYIGTWYFGKRKGQREYNPKSHWLPVEVPPIVSKEIWNAAQKRMSKNKNCAPRNLKYETEYLLRRRLKCDACGTYISCKLNRGVCGTKRYHYYRCHAALSKHSYIHPCYVPSFRADQVDSLVWEWLKSLILDEENLIRGVKNHQRELEERSRPLVDRLNVIDGLLDKNKDKLEEVLDLYLDGDFNKEILVERSNRLEKTIEKLNIERSEIELKLSTSTMTDGQIEEITNYTTYIREGIDIANADFYVRRRIVELLNVTGKLCPEDDRKIVEIECILGEKESLDLTEFKAAQSNMVDSVQHP